MKVKDIKIDYISHIYLINKEDRHKMFVSHYPTDLKLYPDNECEIIDTIIM